MPLTPDPAGDTWYGQLPLTGGDTLSYLAQAMDGAGPLTTGDNNGFFFEPETYQVYLPVVRSEC